MIGGQLGEEFIVGDIGRRCQLGLRADRGLNPMSYLRRGGDALQIFGYIEISLVE